jgi:uncharacterized repeat protein (TIGR04052 family)
MVRFMRQRSRALRSLGVGLGALALAGCSSAEGGKASPIELRFEARFAGEPASCQGSVAELGSAQTSAKLLDYRFFVHEVELMRQDGEPVPLVLEDDGVWQRDGVALLDFEDGSGSCETGSPQTHSFLRGTAEPGDYTGVAFTLGIPEHLNHLDGATAPAPFNAPGMWWSWQGGYKYARIDVATEAHPGGFFFHLGGTNCDGNPSEGFACQYGNLARVELASTSLGAIVVDAAALYRDVDLTVQPDFQSDFVPGCMAFSGDPECPAMFSALGLAFEDGEIASAQTAFAMDGEER